MLGSYGTSANAWKLPVQKCPGSGSHRIPNPQGFLMWLRKPKLHGPDVASHLCGGGGGGGEGLGVRLFSSSSSTGEKAGSGED
jgi:hypothetical protein